MPKEKQFVYLINMTTPCDVRCNECEDACTEYSGIGKKTNIMAHNAIGQLPNASDNWPMIISELCTGCGKCTDVCPENAITKVEYCKSHCNHR